MCMSPHEMTSARIEEIVASYTHSMELEASDEYMQRWYQRKIDSFQEILKERAENGTYETAGGVDNERW